MQDITRATRGFIDRVKDPRRLTLNIVLTGIVVAIMVGTALSIVHLWPGAGQAVQQQAEEGGGEVTNARITSISEVACEDPAMLSDPAAAEQLVAPAEPAPLDCLSVRATLPVGKTVTFDMSGESASQVSFSEGDTVRLIAHERPTADGTETQYSFYDYPRGGKMLTLAIAFVIIVVLVGRWRGALALVGVGAAVALIVTFVLPAILAGKPPTLVAVFGATGIMVIVLYLAHGISHRTTAALFGSLFGIVFTAVAGYGITRWLHFTGIAATEDASLAMSVPGLHMNDVLTATIIIAGLGVLNDITVAQASAVWEMRGLNPTLPKRRIFQSAMRIGRDHIASSIYTLVFAYAGSMLVVLLLLYSQPRDLLDLVTSEQIGQEIVRTLIGAAGLVLSMPVTTAFAVLFAREGDPALASDHNSLGR